MTRQQTLFDPAPRQKPRVLMRVCDAGPGERGAQHNVKFSCGKCGGMSGWLVMKMSDAKRGIPCPVCNKGESNA